MSDETSPKPEVATSPKVKHDEPTEAIQNGNGSSVPAVDKEEANADTAAADASLLKKLLRSRLIEQEKDSIEVERKNPESPLYSVKRFEDLNLKPELLQGLYSMGFTKPSKIQETALPALINDPPQNIIAQSQSGTGKTAAFSLAMLSRIDTNLNYPQALCLAPTMELAAQITDVVRSMGQHMKNLKIISAIRGNHVPRNVPLTEQVIIGTPGTAFDWSSKVNVFSLRKLKVFVLDEADVMIDQQGHQDICCRIVKGLLPQCQVMLFSATYKNPVIEFATRIVKEPMIIRLRRQDESLSYIKQFYVKCDNFETKYRALSNIFGLLTVGQSIIFCHTKRTAKDLTVRLLEDSVPCELLSGELDVMQRASVIKRFRDGLSKMLVTTNVTARGIDVEDVNLVINFDLPITVDYQPDYETYLHRIGRTGRFGKSGVAINFVDSGSMMILEKIQKHFGRPIDRLDAMDPEQIEKINS
jgi:ATP-dependent RNA helicase DDX19/DBP5